jgi:hypothetical protein
LPPEELEDEVLAALINESGRMGFSLMYAHLHEEGVANPAGGLELLEDIERRDWLRILRYTGDPDRYLRAAKHHRSAFLAAYPTLRPSWNPDVDFGEPNLHFEITEDGKAEWRRRHPLERDHAWKAEGDPDGKFRRVWAIDEKLADSVAGPPPYASREVEPATFELKTGDVVEGVKITYRWLNSA